MTVICLSLCIYFAIFSTLDYIKNEDLSLQYISRFENDTINTNPENFHISLVFNYWDKKTNPPKLKTVRGSEFEKYFTIGLNHDSRYRNATTISERINEMDCKKIDLTYNFPPNETHDILKEHICFDLPYTQLIGQFGDKLMSFYQATFSINENYLLNQKVFDEVKNVVVENEFQVNVYYPTKKFDVSNYRDPAISKIDSLSYDILSWYNSDSVNYFFNELIITTDLDPMFNKRESNNYLKFSFHDKIIKAVKDRKIDDPIFIKYNIRPESKKEEMIITPKKFPQFFSDVIAILLLIMRAFGFIVPLFNHFQGKQLIISKTCKIDENLKLLNNNQILELNKIIDDDKKNKNTGRNRNIYTNNKAKDYYKDYFNPKDSKNLNNNDEIDYYKSNINPNDKKNVNSNSEENKENNIREKIDFSQCEVERKIENNNEKIKSIYREIYKINDISNKNEKYSNEKEDKVLNKDIELKKLFPIKENCFNKDKNYQQENNDNKVIENKLENKLENNDIIKESENIDINNKIFNTNANLISDNNNNINSKNNENEFDRKAKMKKMISRRSTNEKIIIKKLKKNDIITLNLLDYICIKLCNNKRSSKYHLYKLLKKKFNYHNDIVYYQNMANEFEIFKKIFLRDDLKELMNFLAKPTISMTECKKLKVKKSKDADEDVDFYKSKEIDFFKILEIYPEMLENVNNKYCDDDINNNNNYDFFHSKIIEMFSNEIKDLNK